MKKLKYTLMLASLLFVLAHSTTYAQIFNYGNGSEGAYTAPPGVSTLSGTHNYTTFTIPAGSTVNVTGTAPLIIRCTGAATINGTLSAVGGAGGSVANTSNVAGAAGVAGGGGGTAGGAGGIGTTLGNNGTKGVDYTGTSGGGTAGTSTVSAAGKGGCGGSYAVAGGNGGGMTNTATPYGDVGLTTVLGGTNILGGSGGGGGGGRALTSTRAGAGGGGGGGGIQITATSITVDVAALIDVRGGAGGNAGGTGQGGAGGGGAGGTVLLQYSTSITGAAPGSTIRIDGGGGGTNSTNNGGAGSVGRYLAVQDCVLPTNAATNFSSSSITSNSGTANWVRGNGTGYSVIVLCRAAGAVNSAPTPGITYTANAAFGSGSQIGTGNYVVYDGAGTSINVTGLAAGQTYHFTVFEYTNTGKCYMSTGLTGSFTLAPSCISTFTPANAATNQNRNVALTWSAVTGATGYKLTIGTNSPNYNNLVNNVDVGNITSYNISPVFPASTTIGWKVVPYNASGDASGCGFNTFTTNNTISYCTSSGSTTSGIRRVIFNTIDNSVNSIPAYTDYTAISTTVTKGVAYNVSVYVNTGGDFTNYQTVYIDWNQNGVFTDAGEEYDLSSITNVTNSAVSGSITVPCSALTGTTRMRVVSRYNASPTPCGTYTDGETEDYTVVVANPASAPNCATLLSPANGSSGICNIGPLQWQAAGSGAAACGYTLYLGTDGGGVSTPTSVSGGGGISVVITTQPFTYHFYNPTGLLPNTTYYWQVVPSNAFGSATGCTTIWSFTTGATPTANNTVPYTQDFEYCSDWTVVNGAQRNIWVQGTAVNNGGSKSMYISNNGGASNQYSTSSGSASIVHFYKDIFIPVGSPTIMTFDWRALGFSFVLPIDYLQVYNAPTSVVPVAGTDLGSTNRLGLYNGSSSFQTVTFYINPAHAGTTRRFIFSWLNDTDPLGSVQPPAAIDNIRFYSMCEAVQNYTATNTGPYCDGQTIQLNNSVPGTLTYQHQENGSFAISNPTFNNIEGNPVSRNTINFSGMGLRAQDLTDLTVSINHPVSSELRIYLVSPSGSRVRMATGLGGATANAYNNTIFNSTSATNITAATAPFTNVAGYLPDQAFTNFTGGADGVWTLQVYDMNTGANTGQLTSWRLRFSNGATFSWSGPNGFSATAPAPFAPGNAADDPSIPSATSANAGTYNLTVTYPAGCTRTASTNVVVQPCSYVWNGTVSQDWFTPGNWTPSGVPNSCASDVTIPTLPTGNQFPIINGTDASVGNITVDNDASITITANRVLNVCGDWSGGTLTPSATFGDGVVVMQGSAQQTISFNTVFNRLLINNTNGVDLADGTTDIYTDAVLKLGTLNTLTGGILRLLSTSPTHCAIINNFGGNTGTLTGPITAQRYISGSGNVQHQMGLPVAANLGQIGAGIDNGYVIPQPTCDETQSATNSPYGNVFRWDESNPTTCILQGWNVMNSGTANESGRGYSTYQTGGNVIEVTGAPNLAGSYAQTGLGNSNYNLPTLQSSGSYTFNSGWHLLANPYPSGYTYTAQAGFGAVGSVYVPSGPYSGTYQPLNNGDQLAPFQGFMVFKTPGAPAT
ncbi:MAG: proprotein convertase P-domain-containing protein, partial [Chitinophagales bacterium]|nr:proprotein convertase P-domain-containing protein [Chitinophagales bacterium]